MTTYSLKHTLKKNFFQPKKYFLVLRPGVPHYK